MTWHRVAVVGRLHALSPLLDSAGAPPFFMAMFTDLYSHTCVPVS